MSGINDLLNVLKIPGALRDMQGEQPPSAAMDKMAGFAEVAGQLERLAALKAKGFGGRGIDTGPIAAHYPETISALVAKMQGVPEPEQGDRAALKAQTLWFMNPIRKDVTGAQAAIEELRQFIMPMGAQIDDDDAVWATKFMNTIKAMKNKHDTYIKAYEQMGYRVPQRVNFDALEKKASKLLFGR